MDKIDYQQILDTFCRWNATSALGLHSLFYNPQHSHTAEDEKRISCFIKITGSEASIWAEEGKRDFFTPWDHTLETIAAETSFGHTLGPCQTRSLADTVLLCPWLACSMVLSWCCPIWLCLTLDPPWCLESSSAWSRVAPTGFLVVN